jgi:hypothetical protein
MASSVVATAVATAVAAAVAHCRIDSIRSWSWSLDYLNIADAASRRDALAPNAPHRAIG